MGECRWKITSGGREHTSSGMRSFAARLVPFEHEYAESITSQLKPEREANNAAANDDRVR